jgi:predicted nucleic acid-binding protein
VQFADQLALPFDDQMREVRAVERQDRAEYRDVPEEVIAVLDAHAARLGLSRSEYVRRRLAQDAATPGSPVSVEDLAGSPAPDLIIATAAELAGLTVLHLDKDFDLIAEITGQPIERLNIRPPAVMG